MAWIDDQWLRTAMDALRATLGSDPHLKKEMVQFLLDEGFWDKETLSWDAAIARFNDGLNPNKAQFFKLGELWALMKRFGRHQFFLAMADDLGYEVRRKPTEERRLELLERIASAQEHAAQITQGSVAELERLTTPDPTRSPGLSGPPRFSKVPRAGECSP